MTAPDLTAIVESADDLRPSMILQGITGEVWRLHRGMWTSVSSGMYDEADVFVEAEGPLHVLATVHATLTALMPLADGWDDLAEKNDRLGMSRIERSEAAAADGDSAAEDDQLKYARVAFASRDAHKSCARELRGVLS